MTQFSATRLASRCRVVAALLAVLLPTGCQSTPGLSTSVDNRLGGLQDPQRVQGRITERTTPEDSRNEVSRHNASLPRGTGDGRIPSRRRSAESPFRITAPPAGYSTPHAPLEAYHVSVPTRPARGAYSETPNVFEAPNSQRPDFLPEPVGRSNVAPVGWDAAVVRATPPGERDILPCPIRCSGSETGPPVVCGPPEAPPCDCDPMLDCCSKRFTFRSDLKAAGRVLRDDARGIVNWNNALILTAAAGGAIAIRQDIDREVRQETARHPNRWNGASKTLGKFGDVPIQIPSILAVYSYSLWTQDEDLHHFSGSLISAYTITGVSTVLLKAAVNTDRPSDEWNGGQYGFPSFHTASSFTIASVIDEYYGPRAGIPAYVFAGLIGWSRIDERDHDVSDVVFGAALGYVIGKSVAGRHLDGDSRVRLLPYADPIDGSTGMMLETRY